MVFEMVDSIMYNGEVIAKCHEMSKCQGGISWKEFGLGLEPASYLGQFS